ncbi:PDDEXK nuclease domain-containing protein, partial [Candidatus Symbiothrix dinenymphae]|uniref:PDDEXK nuclease domain-containing protein n=1 Tax=Candidatus Symbiothrix dinenymphae TaxID=467085 RepID=UPI00070253F6
MDLVQKQNFAELIDNVYQTHYVLQQHAVKAVNRNLTIRNWLTGFYIVEYEQNGADRAQYGTRLLEEIVKSIKAKGVKGYSAMSLKNSRAFYKAYPQIRQSVTVELQKADYNHFMSISSQFLSIRQTVSVELQTADFEEDTSVLTEELAIQQTLSVELQEEYPIPSELLLSRLSFSHFLELLRANDPLERLFYEVETIKNNWSVRELERAIDTALYVRTGLSKNKEAIVAKFNNMKPAQTADIIRNPYFMNFLEMEEKAEYSESDLENALLNHLQQFLIELGTGFCFEARQKRITFDNTHYHIDLVFYHRILKCHVLIDLKIGKFSHADAGQMNVYLNYFRENEMAEGDNPPIGLILCGDK